MTDQVAKRDVLLATPRGFCAGVDRAIDIVSHALQKFGAPIYVRHESVHNTFVVNDLKQKGAIFIEDLDEVPPGATLVFSAHGVSRAVVADADQRQMIAVDATCPLVTKVHIEARRHADNHRHLLLIGHAGHPVPAEPAAKVELIGRAEFANRVEQKSTCCRLFTVSS